MSTTITRFRATARDKMRSRRNYRAFVRAYELASPTMQAELLAISQHQRSI